MLKRVLFAVVGLSLLVGAVDIGALAPSTVWSGRSDHHASAITPSHDGTVVTPATTGTRSRRIALLDALTAIFFAAVFAYVGAAAARRARGPRRRQQYSISYRGPPVRFVTA